MSAAGSRRGFTLVELLISVAITGIVLMGVTGVVRVQQKSYGEGHRQRSSQNAARIALSFIEERAALAGFGLDAPLALDLDRYTPTEGTCPALLDPCPRDSTTGPDELVFYERNASYWTPAAYGPGVGSEPAGNAWNLKGIGEAAVTVHARLGQRFLKGQILQAVCRAGQAYAYMTVKDTTPAVTDPAGADVAVTLLSTVASDPFRQQGNASDGCFGAGAARVFLIDRYRFHVLPVAVTAERYDPYLMLDTGTDLNVDGQVTAADELVVAEGIEMLQVAYVLFDPTLATRGESSAVTLTQAADGSTSGSGLTTLSFPGTVPPGQSVYTPTSWYTLRIGPPADPRRNTDHQANVRALRVAISARSPLPSPDPLAGSGATMFLNLASLPSWLEPSAPYERFVLESQIPLRNMLVRAMNDF